MKKLHLIGLVSLFMLVTMVWPGVVYSQSEKIILYPVPQEFLSTSDFLSHFHSQPRSSILVRDILSSLSPGDRAVMIVGGERLDVITTGMKRRIDGLLTAKKCVDFSIGIYSYILTMKMSEWAKRKGISYMTAWRMWKTGKLPVPAEQLPTGILLRFFNAKDSSNA